MRDVVLESTGYGVGVGIWVLVIGTLQSGWNDLYG